MNYNSLGRGSLFIKSIRKTNEIEAILNYLKTNFVTVLENNNISGKEFNDRKFINGTKKRKLNFL